MNISEHLVKDCWVRRVPLGNVIVSATAGLSNYKRKINSVGSSVFFNMTQEDFANEIEPSAHSVNSPYVSRRAIYAPTGEKDSRGKDKWAIKGYEEVEAISLGLQQSIAWKKASHFAADGFWIANETPNKKDIYDSLASWKDSVGLNTAFLELVLSCFNTGDGAIYQYKKGKDVEYEVFSYDKGDMLFPDIDENGNQVLYRRYVYKGMDAVDIFTTKYRETWMMLPEKTSFVDKIKSVVLKANGEKSEDGYTLVRKDKAQAGDDLLQVTYFRVPDIPSGISQLSIEKLEAACSYVAEEVRSSAFPILFLKSEKIVNMPPSRMNHKTIGVKGNTDSLSHSDAKFLTPPDASDIATLNIKTLYDNIMRSTLSVSLEPDILKGGADSSAAFKLLFTPEIQWAQKEWIYFFKGVRQIMEVFKRLVGQVEGKLTEYADLKISIGQNIWIPQNEKEVVDIEMQQVYGRVKSRKAAMEDIGNSHIDDYTQIQKEWEEEIAMKSNNTEQNPYKPNIDNNDAGKSITDV